MPMTTTASLVRGLRSWRIFCRHQWQKMRTRDGRLMYGCSLCEKTMQRCQRYPYGHDGGIWCPYAECGCQDCADEKRSSRAFEDLIPDDEPVALEACQ